MTRIYTCSECGEAGHSRKAHLKATARLYYCSECGEKGHNKRTHYRNLDTRTEKRCTMCKDTLSVNEFYLNKRSDGQQWYSSWCRPCTAQYSVDKRSLYLHRIPLEKFQAMVAAQGGVCAICKRPPRRKLTVDHDHDCCPGYKSCGKCYRALLCETCNAALGLFGDNVEWLQAAIDYLKEFDQK